MVYEDLPPLHPFVIDLAARFNALDSAGGFGMQRLCKNIDLISYLKNNVSQYYLSEIDCRVIDALFHRSLDAA